MTTAEFLISLGSLSFPNAFNPYSELCERHDQVNAPLIRLNNLRLVLDAAIAGGVDSVWIGRDLGYRGGRRTGLPLTDDGHLVAHSKLYGHLPLTRATHGAPVHERTATLIWQVLSAIDRPVFLWNVFPLHPHLCGEPLTNRCHNKDERRESAHLLKWLLAALRPRSLVAIGNDAGAALREHGFDCVQVRHPSYGGQREFLNAMTVQYRLPVESQRQLRLI